MNSFIRSLAIVTVLLLLGMITAVGQEVQYSAGPGITGILNGNNGGFAWGDINGDGTLDLLFRQNNMMLNNIASFPPLASAALPTGGDATGMAFADFNGDGKPDVLEITQSTWIPAIWLNVGDTTFTQWTSAGDLSGNVGGQGTAFAGVTAADIDHSGYLSLAWVGFFTNVAGSNPPYGHNGGVWLLKGGPTGFTNTGRFALPGNLAIDTTLSYEAWDMRFIDMNNDGYPDLLLPSMRNGFSKIDTGYEGGRKGCVVWLNDKTGKYFVPDAATLGRPIYTLDTAGVYVPVLRLDTIIVGIDTTIKLDTISWRDSLYQVTSAKVDTGIIVDDTVRHFAAIGEQWGELNNDGIPDIVINGLNAGGDNYNGKGVYAVDVILYGKGDGTFTYKWNGVSVVSNDGLAQDRLQRALSIGDYNNDGLQDIYTSPTNEGTARLYRNNGDGTFTNVAIADSVSQTGARSGQLVDYNNDGFLDIFQYQGNTILLQKNGGNSNHWIGFKPIGLGNNKSAIGARFTVYTGATKQTRWIKAEGGAAGMGGEIRALIGIGANTTIDSLGVLWPDGQYQQYRNLDIDRYYTLLEGEVMPDVPTLASPANGATGQPTSLTMTWNTAANAVTYQVELGLDRTFATNVVLNDSLLGTTNQAVIGLGNSSWYYWRVRAFSAASRLWSLWSVVDSFQTIMLVPGPLNLLSPANAAIDQPARITLVVSQSVGAAQYHWQISTSPTFSSYVIDDSTTDTIRTVGPLVAGAKYYWQVIGVNPAGPGTTAGPDSFTVMTAPGVPASLLTPTTNQQSVRVDTVVFTWSSVATASSYECQLSTSSAFGTLAVNADTVTTNSFTVTAGLTRNIYYYWRVRAINIGGASAYTAIDSFKTIVPVPAAPTLLLPTSGATTSRGPIFVWRASNFAASYRLQVSTTSGYTAVVLDKIVSDTTYAVLLPDTLAANTLHYWHVAGIDTAGQGSYSASRIFTTNSVAVGKDPLGPPDKYALLQNYPNPFNPSTMIAYDLPKSSYVKVVIFDMLGRVVANLVDGMQSANRYTVEWNPSHLGSGIYFCRIQARSQDGSDNFTSVKKLIFMK